MIFPLTAFIKSSFTRSCSGCSGPNERERTTLPFRFRSIKRCRASDISPRSWSSLPIRCRPSREQSSAGVIYATHQTEYSEAIPHTRSPLGERLLVRNGCRQAVNSSGFSQKGDFPGGRCDGGFQPAVCVRSKREKRFTVLSRDTESRTYGSETCGARLRSVHRLGLVMLARKRLSGIPANEKENDCPLIAATGLSTERALITANSCQEVIAGKRQSREQHSEDNGFLFLSHLGATHSGMRPRSVFAFGGFLCFLLLSFSFRCFVPLLNLNPNPPRSGACALKCRGSFGCKHRI